MKKTVPTESRFWHSVVYSKQTFKSLNRFRHTGAIRFMHCKRSMCPNPNKTEVDSLWNIYSYRKITNKVTIGELKIEQK